MGSFLQHRPALATSCGAGAVAGALAGAWLPASTAVLVGWCAAAATHLALLVRTMLRITPETARRCAALLPDDKWSVLGGSLAAALASLAAVAVNLAGTPTAGSAALGAFTVALSWASVHVLMAQHYMHEHWFAGEGLVFPGTARPARSSSSTSPS